MRQSTFQKYLLKRNKYKQQGDDPDNLPREKLLVVFLDHDNNIMIAQLSGKV